MCFKNHGQVYSAIDTRGIVSMILLSLSLVLMLFSIQFGHAQDDGK